MSVFIINPEAERYHQEGLAIMADVDVYADETELHEARSAFTSALGVLDDIRPEIADTVDTHIQQERIIRDISRAYVYQAVGEYCDWFDFNVVARTLIEDAQNELENARLLTAPYVSGEPMPLQRLQRPKAARHEVAAEHATTLAHIAQLVTLRAVLDEFGTWESNKAEEHRRYDQQPYGAAHDIFKNGNRGDLRVEHAIRGARQEQLNGDRKGTLPWLGRAAYGLGWTIIRDTSHFPAALKAFRQIGSLKSYEAAKDSVLADYPTYDR